MQQWTKKHLKQYIADNLNLVSVKPVHKYWPEHYFSVLKYKRKVFYKNLWTPELCEFRGTVVDENFDIVLRPPTKIFNYGEHGETFERDESCTFVQKINGFMCAATVLDGKVLVSTTGSMDSEFSRLASKWVQPFADGLIAQGEGITYTFEVVDPSDPHIVKEATGLYLLAVRVNKWNTPDNLLTQDMLDTVAACIGEANPNKVCSPHGNYIMRPLWFFEDFGKGVDSAKTQRHEGFVVYSHITGKVLKLKTPYYLTTKFIGRMRDKRFLDLMNNPQVFKEKLDEEFYGIIDHLGTVKDSYIALDKQARIDYVRTYFDRNL